MYFKEKEIEGIEKKYTRFEEETSGNYLFEATNRIKLTEKLLENYRKIRFNAQNSTGIMLGTASVDEAVQLQIKNAGYKNINSFCQEQIEQAVKKVKNYPQNGPLYYKILQSRFIQKDFCTYDKIAKANRTSKQNILQKKNEAIKIVADILWESVPSDLELYFAEYQAKRFTVRTE